MSDQDGKECEAREVGRTEWRRQCSVFVRPMSPKHEIRN